jgi:hypothetical protein
VDVLGVPESLVDGETTAVELDHFRRAEVGTARRQAPRFLHPPLTHHDHRGQHVEVVGNGRIKIARCFA